MEILLYLLLGSIALLIFYDLKYFGIPIWLISLTLIIGLLHSRALLQGNFITNLGLLLCFYLVMIVLEKTIGVKNMGLGDWLFLCLPAMYLTSFDFLVFSVLSNLIGILWIVIIPMVRNFEKQRQIRTQKAPMVSIYGAIMFSYLIIYG